MLPEDLKQDAIDSARSLVGSGYIDDYYRSIVSEFEWLYEVGYERGKLDAKKAERVRKRRKTGGRKK